MKATALAHPNIAFTKYWGNKNSEYNIPANNSISMNLDGCITKTTVEFSNEYKEDKLTIDSIPVIRQAGVRDPYMVLDLVRKLAGENYGAKVISENNFPKKAGIASSASGGAALALAATKAIGLELAEDEISKIARWFSGSACRSVPTGFVEWYAGFNHEDSIAKSIAPPEHWDLMDIVAIVNWEEKKIGSKEGHEFAKTSNCYEARLSHMEKRNDYVRRAIENGDIETLGEICEEDCLSMHAVMLTSKPSLRYLTGGTIKLMDAIENWRKEGMDVYFTIDAGPNVHIITLPEHENEIINSLSDLQVKDYIINKPGGPARSIDEHLF